MFIRTNVRNLHNIGLEVPQSLAYLAEILSVLDNMKLSHTLLTQERRYLSNLTLILKLEAVIYKIKFKTFSSLSKMVFFPVFSVNIFSVMLNLNVCMILTPPPPFSKNDCRYVISNHHGHYYNKQKRCIFNNLFLNWFIKVYSNSKSRIVP